jgi:hypothetical protein
MEEPGMTRKMGMVVVAAMLMAASTVMAADDVKKPAASKTTKAAAAKVTQGELAQMLVNVTGLFRFLPPNPTDSECVAILLQNRIAPADGWSIEKPVSRADLARVVVQAMHQESEVKNPDDPRSWINYLKGLGVPIDTVGESISNIKPSAQPVGQNVFAVPGQSDPIRRRNRFGEPDETEFGVDAQFVGNVLSFAEFKESPVTPDTP